jgi:hypothetical protein
MKDNFKGILAAQWIKKNGDDCETKAYGHYIAETDFFEKNKRQILESFQNASIEDDIFVLTHREDLI